MAEGPVPQSAQDLLRRVERSCWLCLGLAVFLVGISWIASSGLRLSATWTFPFIVLGMIMFVVSVIGLVVVGVARLSRGRR